jgi:hypothetical protein
MTTPNARDGALDVVNVSAPMGLEESDWRTRLPLISAPGITLRELRTSDARALLELLGARDKLSRRRGWACTSRRKNSTSGVRA